MSALAQNGLQILMFLGALGLLGLPLVVWRRPPQYYWRCPHCRTPNAQAIRECRQCSYRVAEEHLRVLLRANWRVADLVALYLTTLVVALSSWTVLVILMGPAVSISDPERLLAFAREPESVWILTTLLSGVLTLLSLWVLGNRFRWTLPELGLHSFQRWMMVTLGTVVGTLAFGVGLLVVVFASWSAGVPIGAVAMLRIFPVRVSDPLWMLIVPTLLVLNPLGTELFFRGMFYRYARARWHPRVALWTTAVLFTVASGAIGPTASLVLLGLANSVLFERTGSLIPGIAANVTLGLAMILWALIHPAPVGL